MLDIIAERMKLVSVHIELLGFACRTSRSATFLDFSLMSFVSFTWQLPGIKCCACILLEEAKLFSKGLSLSAKNIKSFLMVHLKFGQCVPMSQVKQKLEYLFVVRLREETFKNWYHGLKDFKFEAVFRV